MRIFASWLLWLGCLFAVTTIRAEPVLDVLAGGAQRAELLASWCATSTATTVEAVTGDGCQLEPLLAREVTPGFDHRAFWLRLNLANPGALPVERWITVGHPRLANVSLFVPEAKRWVRHDVGNLVPMAHRGRVERDFGVLPVTIGAESQTSVWLRVQTDTSVDLATTVWAPTDFISARQGNQFWVSLGLGSLLITILFSMLMLILTRQPAYGYYALGLSGSLFTVCLTSGLLQRFIWPEHWPLPAGCIALGNLFAVLGFYGFIRAFLPQRRRYRRTNQFLKVAVLVTVVVLLYAITVDYASVAKFSGGFILLMITGVVLLTFRAWRDEDQSAGVLLIAFSIYGLLVGYRLLFALGIFSWMPEAALIGVWGMLLSAPVVLLGLVSRTRQLQTELILAQSENTAQLAFFARLSHELRSPLDTILGNAQLLARMGQGTALTSGLTAIFESGRHLLRMIDHLLDYARGLSGAIRVSPAPLDMEAFLRGIERTGWLFAAKRHNRFVMKVDSDVRDLGHQFLELDASHLREVLDNLLSNAARHTQDGCMGLTYRISEQSGSLLRLEFTVWDSGEGIAEEDLQRIFDPFERVGQPGHQNTKGVGLGLAIARHLTDLMGGQLTVESVVGQGSRFRFWVLARPVSADVRAVDECVSGLEAVGYEGIRRTILLVDDDDVNRSILARLLGDLGFSVLHAHSGDEVADLLKGLDQVDLVITDQFMPHGDGWQVLRLMQEVHPDVPVFLVSAAPPLPGKEVGPGRFTQHFLRPLDHVRLLDHIGDQLGLIWIAAQKGQEHALKPVEKVPPLSELRSLSDLVANGQVTAIEKWAREIQGKDARYADYVERVLVAVDNLDLQTLAQLSSPDASDDAVKDSH